MSFSSITAMIVAFLTTLILLAHAQPQLHGRINKKQQFHEYSTLLKSENRTEFPDRDIRSLLNPGLRSSSKLKTKNSRDSPRLPSDQTRRRQHFGSSKSDLPLTLTDGHGRFPHNVLANGILLSTSTATSTSTILSPSSSLSSSSKHTDVDVKFTSSLTRRQKKKKKSKRKHRKHGDVAKSSSSTWDSISSSDTNELEADNLDALLPKAKDSSHSRRKNSGRRKKSSKEKRRKHKRKQRRRGKKRQRKIPSSQTSMVLTHKSNFPPLKERCKTRPMQQEIKVKGCAPKTITNNFCYGQCNSFYIPELQGRGDGPPSFLSCSFCRPRVIRHIIVQLRCMGRNGRARWKKRKVPYIKQCKCIAQETNNCF